MDLHKIVSALKKLAKELGKTPSQIEFVSHTGISDRQVNKHKYSKLCKMAGIEPNKNSQQKKPVRVKVRPPKILIFDIEVAPMKTFVYGIFDQNIGINQIEKDWFLFSFAAKWIGKDKIHYYDNRSRRNVWDDRKLCEKLHKLLDEADIVIGHNSDGFDIKKCNTRFEFYKMPPVEFSQTIDTLKIARRYFKLTSNKLDYIAQYFGIEGKYKSKKFHGFELWRQCYNKNKEAFEEMEAYNKQDVWVTEKVYDRLKKWHAPLNFQAYVQEAICVCGSKNFKKDGVRYTKQSAYQRYRCIKCGKNFTGKENLINKDTRQDFFK